MVGVFLVTSCDFKKIHVGVEKPIPNFEVNDSILVKNFEYQKGDIRRYGLFPNQKNNYDELHAILDLSELGLPIYFPKGYYAMSLNLKGRRNVIIRFDDVVIGGALQITNKKDKVSERISIEGRLTLLDKLFIRESKNISFDTVYVKSDTSKNIFKLKNRGVSIYSGSSYIIFNLLKVINTGGEANNHFKHTAAAVQIHGWNNNPYNIHINSLELNEVGRSGVYITGKNHKIKNTIVSNFGSGSQEGIFSLGDAKPGEEKLFSGLWINKCNNCHFNFVTINNAKGKGNYSLRLDEGNYAEPTFIYSLQLDARAKEMKILDDKLTNILVKKAN